MGLKDKVEFVIGMAGLFGSFALSLGLLIVALAGLFIMIAGG